MNSFPGLASVGFKDDYKLANLTYEHLKAEILEQQSELGDDEELVVWYYPGGAAAAIRVLNVGYWNPFSIYLHGFDHEGDECTVVVHMNSLALVLKRRKIQAEAARQPIGFVAQPSAATPAE